MPDSLLPVNRFDVSLYLEKMRTLKNDTSAIQDLIKNLCYSPAVDGAYCLPCVLFGEKFPTKTNKIKKLFSESFRYWPDANAQFLKHNSSTELHADTSAVFTSFIRNYFAIIYSGRQGHALRGQRDDSQYHGEVGEFSCGRVGNFVELLNFRVQGGDTILAEHLKNSPKNATYISKTTQNELISCCGEFILDKLVSEIKNNVFYSILADEASDSSHKEQMSLVLRFVDDSFNIREEFIQFIHCDEGLSGKDLQSVLCKCLEHLKLDIKDCRGQAYDGAGAVAGYKNGLSARILSLNRKAIYVHCNSHRLNLSVGKFIQQIHFSKIYAKEWFYTLKKLLHLFTNRKLNKCFCLAMPQGKQSLGEPRNIVTDKTEVEYGVSTEVFKSVFTLVASYERKNWDHFHKHNFKVRRKSKSESSRKVLRIKETYSQHRKCMFDHSKIVDGAQHCSI
ncbi:zinc finger MYM-type protein 1-like [Hydractinia symbiolongicarpus]|uniref:zinc finger MYM-type protein 1-like n=1 Tax=Hydractinia symbiolongicarpus TaxID=13093 RepID=UPI002551201A|nr:zinc finger MYM-type protein 1-like [Hydractinia symbiolongicarpus]